MKIFIADDSAPIRERLKIMISEIPGAEIIGEAEDGVRAIADIKELTPDIVILDIRMAGENGINVLKAIKKERQPPIVMMLTSYPYPQYRLKCMELGADYFFKKGTESEKVKKVIEKLISEVETHA